MADALVTARVGAGRTVRLTFVVAEIDPLVAVIAMLFVAAPVPLATASVAVLLAPALTVAGLKLRLTPLGVLAVRATDPAKPLTPVTAMVNVADLPGSNDSVVTDGLSVKPGWVAPALGHPSTSRLASTEPRPVARLYAAPLAMKPMTPGTELLPVGVA